MAELQIDVIKIRRAKMVLRAINHKLRLQMLQFIHKSKRITVTEIYVKLRLEQSVASQHLAILRRERFVNTEREGKQIFYSVNYERLNEVQAICTQLLESTKKT